MKALSLFLLCSICILSSEAQSDETRIDYKRSFWAEGGLGYAKTRIGMTGNASFEVLRNVILSYEYDSSFDLNYIIGEPNETDTDSRGFTIGYLRKEKQKMFYLTAGATKIKGTIRESSIEEAYNVWNAKIRIGFLYSWEYIAIGISPYVNLNSTISYGGITANLAFGRFIKLKD